MKKLIFILFSVLITTNVFAYNPSSFVDEETISVNGKRPKVDISSSEQIVNINIEDFVDGIASKILTISNDGNTPCYLSVEIQNVPVDLTVNATIDSDYLMRGESTPLNINVELSEQQEAEDFAFTIKITATLRP